MGGFIQAINRSILETQKKVKITLATYFAQGESTSVMQHLFFVSQSIRGGRKYDGADIYGLRVVTVAASLFLPNSKG